MKFEARPSKQVAQTRSPLPRRTTAELRALAKLWGNPGDDVDAAPPRHLRGRRPPRRA